MTQNVGYINIITNHNRNNSNNYIILKLYLIIMKHFRTNHPV